jgi:hypothetical protein
MKLRVPVHSMKLFTYDKINKTFVTEASNLGNVYASRIYDDACDIGFEIESPVTGKKVLFWLYEEHRTQDEDREITHWTFKDVGYFKAIVYND